MALHGPHTSEYLVDDGADHVYHPQTMKNVRSLFLDIKYKGLHPTVYQWDEGTQCYEFSQELTDEMHSIPRTSGPGRPRERQGDYEKISLEIRRDLLAKIDASDKSRREYIEELLEKQIDAMIAKDGAIIL